MQIDIGFGDKVVPDPTEMVFPTLLDTEPPFILGYTPETVIAEKFEAALDLADLNSRMKDFYDIWFLCQICAFMGRILQEAIIATSKSSPIPRPRHCAATAIVLMCASSATSQKPP